jgi:hypothetical protein
MAKRERCGKDLKGVEVKCRKDRIGGISVEEEELFWAKGLLGCDSVEYL